ncbi:MAG: SUMF1/EgtB/PvdO family nonheme iron enzyme [Labilithrix sp.]|nr:SUMF1/EgtB/PvdO family nonheme iron enzyme [Labilithrix sp.]
MIIYRSISVPELWGIFILPISGLLVVGGGACDGSGARGGPRRARPDQIPEQVAINEGTSTYGFFISRDRRPLDVGAFRVAKRPVTVAQYNECVAAGACSGAVENACIGVEDGLRDALAGRTQGSDADEAIPMTCVGVRQAQAYCGWVGGALPTISQWLTAARGREVARFSWGNTLPRCEQHPAVTHSVIGGPCAESQDQTFAVGRHVAGTSPLGVEDVLLASGELIAPSSDSPVSACAAPFPACVAYGVRPGAIDSVEALDGVDTEAGERSRQAYAFRCAFPGDSK